MEMRNFFMSDKLRCEDNRSLLGAWLSIEYLETNRLAVTWSNGGNQGLAVGLEDLVADIESAGNAVELKIGLDNLQIQNAAGEVEQVETLHRVFAVAESNRLPLPDDAVAASDVNAEGLGYERWVALGLGDEDLLRWGGKSPELGI